METKFFTDIKVPVMAGMPFSYKFTGCKIGKIGHDIIRIYYDSIWKDCMVNEVRIKRVLYKTN